MDDRTTPDFLPADPAKAVHSSILLKYLHQVESQCRNLKRKPLGSPEQTLKVMVFVQLAGRGPWGAKLRSILQFGLILLTMLIVRKLNYMFYEIN